MKLLSFAVLASTLTLAACGDEHGHGDTDEAEFSFTTAPPATLTAGEDQDVTYHMHVHGDLHHTELRACQGDVADCGLGSDDSYDENFAVSDNGDETYTGVVNLTVVGTWTIVGYAHVGESPFTSDPVVVEVVEQ